LPFRLATLSLLLLGFQGVGIASPLLVTQPPLRDEADEERAAEDSEDAEWRLESSERMTELRAERELLQTRLDDVQEQLRWLARLRDARTRLEKLERRFERRESEEPDRESEDETDFDAEQAVEQAEIRLYFLEQAQTLTRLRGEFLADGLLALHAEGGKLRAVHEERIKAADELFQIWEREDEANEEAAERLEERMWDLGDRFERGLESLSLRAELFWAREEDDAERADELEDELRSLGFETDGRPLPEPAAPTGMLSAPVSVNEDDRAAAANLDFETDVLPLLRTHCGDCHSGLIAEGGLDFDRLAAARPLVVERQQWENVAQQLRVRSMPPADAAEVPEADRRRLVAYLTHAIDHFDYSSVGTVGREPARRLTREEYDNTIRDLFGADLRPSDRFPPDLAATSGFDNSANSLFLQPILMERYVGAAERIVEEVLPRDASGGSTDVGRLLLAGRPPRDALPNYLARAFRRPLVAEERARYLQFFDDAVQDGASPWGAFREVVQASLISPSFLLRSERPPEQAARNGPVGAWAVSEYELASRLSYFLWASMPDEELFRLAAAGRLSDPATLQKQVDRMLDDPKAAALGRVFVGQWLGFSKLDRVRPDRIDHPWATDTLIDAMKAESALFFDALLRENEPVERLLTADYTFLNEELAALYGIRGVAGPEMRRVDLRGSERGGALGHGSILAITSFPGRTSPTLRGNWILSELLGTPPPPPPPNVSQFDERLAELESLTEREKLERHRANPACYVCHREIDPLGFALQRYDWFGRDRTQLGERMPDTDGELPDGTAVNGLAGLKEALVKTRLDPLVIQLTRKMLSYALGRQLDYRDEATVREIAATVRSDGRRLRTLVREIVLSDAFRMNQTIAVEPHAVPPAFEDP
ncbi:MAG: DUF1592 domain-containing protein, partial [Planctomycetota bacterium]